MDKSKFYWSVNKDTPTHDLNIFVEFKGRLFKKGGMKTDVWESEVCDDSLKVVFGDPILIKYEIDDEITYFNNKIKVVDNHFTEIDGKWDISYDCLNEQNVPVKVLQLLL